MSHGYVLFISTPCDINMCCPQHKNGCGNYLRVGDVVFVDGAEMEMIKSQIVNFAVRKLSDKGHRLCKIGIMRCIFCQCHLIGNRVGRVTKIFRRTGDQIRTWTSADGPPQLSLYQRKNDNKNKKEGDKTLELIKDCHGVAVVTFLDGGYSTALPIRSENEKDREHLKIVELDPDADDDNSTNATRDFKDKNLIWDGFGYDDDDSSLNSKMSGGKGGGGGGGGDRSGAKRKRK